MKNFSRGFAAICSLLLFIPEAGAQVIPPYAKSSAGTASINFMGNGNNKKYQMIYEPADLTGSKPLRSGMITKLYYRSSDPAQSATFTDLRILLKQSPSKVFPGTNGLTFFTGFDTVYSRSSVTIKGSSLTNGWYAIELDIPYFYDSTQSLIFELQYSAMTSGEIRTIASASTAAPNHKKLYATTVAATTGTQNAANWQDFGIDINTSYNNASVKELFAPSGFCQGNQDIVVRIENTGRNVLNTVTVNWTLDNVPQPPVYWTDPLDTIGGTSYRNDTAIRIGNVHFGSASRAIRVWTENPNSVPDVTNNDDTLARTLRAGLNGLYTIGGSGADYATPGAAAADMNNHGVCGPVTFHVTSGSGPYAESIALDHVKGLSAVNAVIFYGNGNTISHSVSPLVSLTGVSHILFDSFNLVAPASYTGTGIYIGEQSHHITLSRNRINLGTTSTSSSPAGIAVSGDKASPATAGDNAQYVTISNNEIIGGNYSIILMGNSGYLNNYGHRVINNTCRDFYSYGIYLANADTCTVSGNNINRAGRTSFTTFYGINLTTSRNLLIRKNRIHHAGSGSYNAYPFHIANCVNQVGYETEISNNLVYQVGTTSTFNGIYCLTTATSGFRFYYNSIQHEVASGSPTVRGAFFNVAMTNIEFRNNIISISGTGTGTRTGIYVTTASAGLSSNNNVIHLGGSGTNNTGFWTSAKATLASWQSASSQDLNSVSNDPVFSGAATGNLIPTSGSVDNIGASVSVPDDILGNLRPAVPDAGAFEFTAAVSGDISIENGSLKRSGVCYSSSDSVFVTVKNLIGNTIDFSIHPLSIIWNAGGPVNSNGLITVSSGTLAPGASATYSANAVNMTKPGSYQLAAYIQPNLVNLVTSNDTLAAPAPFTVDPLFFVSPRTATVNSSSDTVVLKAGSPFFPPRSIFQSEVCHNKNLTASTPVGGWPAYLKAGDYIEITGIPNADLAGYRLEEWSGSSLQYAHTFPAGTLFSPGGTMIVAIGELNSSVPSPADFYYHSGNSANHNTGQSWGYLIRDSNGAIVDAITHRAYTFPAAAGVTMADWYGTTTPSGGAGMRLIGPDNNNASCWAAESPSGLQNPNALNSNVPPAANTQVNGLRWTYLGSPLSTERAIVVGRYSTPGTYEYIASHSNTCGTFYDTAFITAAATVPVKLSSFTGRKNSDNVLLDWSTASETNNDHFAVQRSADNLEFETIGEVKGHGCTSGTTIYRFEDAGAFSSYSGTLYYRLQQFDHDGRSELSHTVNITAERSKTVYTIVPNPFSIVPVLHVSNPENNKKVEISINDIHGRWISKRQVDLNAGDNVLQLDEMRAEEGGVYFVTVSGDKEVTVKRIIKF